MFRHLRIKLTVLYAGLFCAALALISLTAYAVITGNAKRMVRDELQATGTVFDRVWQLRFEKLQDGANLSARDYGFREAVATRDDITIGSALNNLRRRMDADFVFLVTPEGQIILEGGASQQLASFSLRAALENEDAPFGMLMAEGFPHQAVTAPVFAPNLLGWIVIGERLDGVEMQALEGLSAIPLEANVLVQDSDERWRLSEGALQPGQQHALGAFIDRSRAADIALPGQLDAGDGPAIALMRPLRSLDGVQSVLLLRYPLSSALAPYHGLFNTLIAIGIVGVSLLMIGSWLLAQGITQPISKLEKAARGLEDGAYEPVILRTHDEIGRLAERFNAMAAAIQARERKIMQQALHDSETMLPNRLALERKLAPEAVIRDPRPLFLAAIGIDRFAHVRGAIGYTHASGLIRKLGLRLAKLAPNAPVARLSTDVLALAFLADDEEAARKRIRKLQTALEQSVALDRQVVDVDTTIGVAAVINRHERPGELIERASIALDQARAARVKLSFFDETAYGDPTRNISLMSDMRRAIANGEMYLAHQPKLSYRTNAIEGVECLVRWRHPLRGLIAPDVFIPMAEETGHIRALTEWVLARAIEDQAKLKEAGWPLTMSVNISGRLLADREFAHVVLRAVKAAPGPLCLEITETAIIANPELALQNVDLFVRNGALIAIDDYGSGLSSLAYLKQLPAHELKIDKVFIESLTNSQRDALLVRSTIELAHGLGLKVTAEGVENPAAFALLAAMGCDVAQGYLIARPAPVDDVLTVLNDSRRSEFLDQARKAMA